MAQQKNEVVDSAFDVCFVVQLDDQDAVDRYAKHATHVKAAKKLFLPLSRKIVFYDIFGEKRDAPRAATFRTARGSGGNNAATIASGIARLSYRPGKKANRGRRCREEEDREPKGAGQGPHR